MNKKQVIILLVTGLVILTSTFLGVYLMRNNNDNKPKESKTIKNVVKLKDYTLEYGTYIGEEKTYNPDTGKITTKNIKIILTKDTIGEEYYFVKDNSLYMGTKDNNTEMYEVNKNNEFTLLAGSGIHYKLEGK